LTTAHDKAASFHVFEESMRKSKTITLILLTSSLFLGCEDKVRNQYASWDDCVKDYRDPTKCEAEANSSTGYRTTYYGPWYRQSGSSDYARNPSSVTKRAIGVSRGGFGSSGGSHASS
jgi:uncharacterized protein YgiB involved in biofilm formation